MIFASIGGSVGKLRVYGKWCERIRVDTLRNLVIIAVVGKIGNPLTLDRLQSHAGLGSPSRLSFSRSSDCFSRPVQGNLAAWRREGKKRDGGARGVRDDTASAQSSGCVRREGTWVKRLRSGRIPVSDG
jgi:hypothetical protein